MADTRSGPWRRCACCRSGARWQALRSIVLAPKKGRRRTDDGARIGQRGVDQRQHVTRGERPGDVQEQRVARAEGQYQEIQAPYRLVTSADFRPMTEGVVLEVILEAKGDQTNFTFNVIHETEEYCKQQEAMGFYNGWASTFDRLEELLSLS